MREINLFRIHREVSERGLGFVRGAKLVTFLLLILYCLVAAGIFSFWLVLRRQNEVVTSRIKFQEQRIKELKPVESLHAFLKQRLSTLAPLLTKETVDYKETLTHLETLLPEGLTLTKIELNQEGNLSFTGTAPNAVVLSDFLERLISSEGDEFAKNAKLTSASRQEDGSYSFSLNLDVEI